MCDAGAGRDLLGGLPGGRERENAVDRFVDVPEIDEIVLHSGTASVYRRSQVPEGLILPLSMSVRGKRFVFTE